MQTFVSDIAIFVLKRDVKLQPTDADVSVMLIDKHDKLIACFFKLYEYG